MPRPVPPALSGIAAALRPPMRALLGQRWAGAHHLPASGGFVVVANHVSNLDGPLVGDFLLASGAPPAFLAKSELFARPRVGALLRSAGQVEVRRDTDAAEQSLDAAREAVAEGRCVVVFPEGTFTRDPDLWPMTARPGAARLALETGAPLVPVVCWGGQRVLPPFTSRFRPFPRETAQVVAGPPMTRTELLGGVDEAADPAVGPAEGTAAAGPDGGPAAGAGADPAVVATDAIMDRLTAMLAVVRGETPPARRWDTRIDGDPHPRRPRSGR
ncbi:MAG: lysophospholipid acyltransferase family protein [Actinomycetaceae bacterium]